MGLHTKRQCFGVAFYVCAWCPRSDHRGMLRFDYASPSASSPLLPLSLLASSAKRRPSRRHPYPSGQRHALANHGTKSAAESLLPRSLPLPSLSTPRLRLR